MRIPELDVKKPGLKNGLIAQIAKLNITIYFIYLFLTETKQILYTTYKIVTIINRNPNIPN